MPSSAPGKSSSSRSTASGSNADEPMYQVKLLSALRNGDPAVIHPFLIEIGKDKRTSSDGVLDTGAAALHLAIRCASASTVSLLLSYRAISPNAFYSGTSALHLASSLGRLDIVTLLLEQDKIDDTLLDNNGKTCTEVAKGKDIVRAIEDSRAFLNASYCSLLRTYILSPLNTPPSPALLSLLESPRVRFINLSYLDDDSGTSLLHEAARRKDLRLIELAVRAGADVFVRNRKGKMAYEGTGKDDRVRVFLRQLANHDSTLIQTPAPAAEPAALKGYLNKFVNMAKGHQPRWFILDNGVLSYYRHQEDEAVASRGSIAMKTALLRISPTDRHKFEVWSTPSRGHTSGIQKWYIKANHPVEASRWTQAIAKSIEWHKREPEGRQSGESDASGNTHFKSVAASSFHSRRDSHKTSIGGPGSEVESMVSSRRASPNTHDEDRRSIGEDQSSASESIRKTLPFDSSFDLQGNSTSAQMELTAQLINNLVRPDHVPERSKDLRTAVKDSFAVVQGMLDEYVQMVKVREEWFTKQLRRERDKSTMWEESFATVVREGENLENELRARSRKRGSRFFDAGTGDSTIKQRRSIMGAPKEAVVPEETTGLSEVFTASSRTTSPTTATRPTMGLRASTQTTPTLGTSHSEEEFDTDEEDEFFDAIESNTLPNLVIPESLTSPTHVESALPNPGLTLPYEGYKKIRETLNLTNERPNQSLWSVLKNSIGKDLTKISFPVSFNEPTSMLQRMAEDMEFSECLDVAAREKDPLLRIAYVAAFAMSNYSSTIGRIAKPFNPMLSETFEYVRLDKEYRYMSEQVSHHPPISACYAESPYWHYYGEVDAQNKFMGKSFEIRPTGMAHAELALDSELGPGYPKTRGKAQVGKVSEHYSWKKVTTNVSGFILGSPTIDHYGDMTVVNHRTNDRCILTFKPRGWRGRDAFEISGSVIDAEGNTRYEIAGRWNSQLVAREVGYGHGALQPDTMANGPMSPSLNRGHILLWRNSEKPANSPFNLTPFAISLNNCPADTLKPFLCPTDCRLRPDQRSFELGKYDLANGLKQDQEEKQRAIRRAREAGEMPPHKPRWFQAETDGDTGERVWVPSIADDSNLEYWGERERVWRAKYDGQPAIWRDVDDIFIEEPDFLR